MYLSEKGYWRPDSGELVVLVEEPHVVKLISMTEKGTCRHISIPHAYRDGLMVGTELLVESIYSAQDMHYEWIRVAPTSEYLISQGVTFIEIPQRYCKMHPDKNYPNTCKSE